MIKMKLRMFLAALLFLGLPACANESGNGWAELQGTLTIGVEDLEARRLPDGAIKTSTSFAVSVDKFELAIDALEFTAGPEDGAVEDAESLVEVHLEETVPLLAGAEFAIGPATCGDACVIAEKTEITGVRLGLVHFEASGTVQDLSSADRLGAPERKWHLAIPLLGTMLMESIEIPVEGEPYEISAAVAVEILPTLFDAIDWQQSVTAETLPASVGEAVRGVLMESHLEVESNVEPHEESEIPEEEEPEDDGHGH